MMRATILKTNPKVATDQTLPHQTHQIVVAIVIIMPVEVTEIRSIILWFKIALKIIAITNAMNVHNMGISQLTDRNKILHPPEQILLKSNSFSTMTRKKRTLEILITHRLPVIMNNLHQLVRLTHILTQMSLSRMNPQAIQVRQIALRFLARRIALK